MKKTEVLSMAALLCSIAGCYVPTAPAAGSSDTGGDGAPMSVAPSLPLALGGAATTPVLAPATTPMTTHSYGAMVPADAAPATNVPAAAALPASVDLSADAPPPGDQGQTGSCQSWSTGYSAMGWWANHSGLSGARFAPMYLYAQLVKGNCDDGASIEAPLALLKSQGIETQTDYEPMQYDLDCATTPTSAQKSNAGKFKITGYTRSDLSKGARPAIMAVLAGGRPAILAIGVYPELENATATKYLVGPPQAGDKLLGTHAITAFKYDENGVWILNQWGSDWGRGGWAQLSWDFVYGSFAGESNVLDVASIDGVKLSCADSNDQCAVWAFSAQCQANPSYMLGTCCASCANPEPTFTASTEWYRIQNVGLGAGYSLDTSVMNPTGNYSGQYWKLSPLGGGVFRLTNQFQGDGMSFDTTNMAATGQYTGQFWTLTALTNGVYRLTNDYLGAGMSLQSAGAAKNVVSAKTAATSNQYWEISPIP